jgi:hypothetical protein
MYSKYFKKILQEDGPNYVATSPNTAGRGGAVGNSSSMYTNGTASGTTGTDTYAAGDYRMPKSIFGGKIARRNLSIQNRFPKRGKSSKKK